MAVWAALIWSLSTDAFSGDGTGRFLTPVLEILLPGASPDTIGIAHAVVRKLAHVTEYAILAVLLLRALYDPERQSRPVALSAVALCALYAVTDEFHQSFVASRTAAVSDVLLDTVGAAVGAGLASWAGRSFSSGRRSPA